MCLLSAMYSPRTPLPLHWALNVGSDYSKTFVPEEISWLAEMVEENLNQAEEPA